MRKPSELNKQKYCKARNKYDRMIKMKKQNYIKSKLEENKYNLRETWRIINNLLGRKTQQQTNPMSINGTLVTDDVIVANHFNDYFSSVADNLVKTIPTSSSFFYNYLNKSVGNSIFLKPTTPKEIKDVISTLKPKLSSGVDNIPMKIIKHIPDTIVELLAWIFNMSIEQGQYPTRFKTAKVTPIFKKGNRKFANNYRPISLLPGFSKILERIIHSRVSNFLEKHEVFYELQFGFRKDHSTELAVTYMVSDIANAIESGQTTMGIFLDLSKAFDTINHNILLSKLCHYGIRGNANKWFKSYLSNRRQLTEFNKVQSNYRNVQHGVPQGSILGPLLFLVYINDFQNCLDQAHPIMFADDTNIFIKHKQIDIVYDQAQCELHNIASWLSANRLSLNADKTKYTIFHTHKKSYNMQFPILRFNNKPIERVKKTPFLGVLLDENLSWKSHMLALFQKMRRNVGIIYKLKSYLNSNNLICIYHSLIASHLRYCITSWNHGNTILAKKIDNHCSKVIKLIVKSNCNTTNLFSVTDMYTLEMGKLMHKFNQNQLPTIFKNLFRPNNTVHSHSTRNRYAYHLPFYSTSVSQQSIQYSGAKVWNALPSDIRALQSRSAFVTKLKKHLSQ